MRTWGYDLRYAVRMLTRSPGFFAVAIATLAIGIGANTAMFAVVNGVLLKPLPFDDPESLELVRLLRPDSDEGPGAMRPMVWSYPKYRTFRDMQTVFGEAALFAPRELSLTHVDEPERIRGEVITTAYPGVLGVRPVLGRAFTAEEADSAGAMRVAMIGEGFRATRFGNDVDVLGRTIHFNGMPYTIVGVLPRGFRGLSGQADVWLPLAALEPGAIDQAYSHAYSLVARRKADVTPEAADAAMQVVGPRIDAAYTEGPPGPPWTASSVALSSSRIDGAMRRTAVMLLAAIGFVLLIACVNLTTLLATKARGRWREVAVRMALGASRWRIARQFVAESVVLALTGGAAGLLVASALLTAGAALLPAGNVFFQRTGSAPALNPPSDGLTRVGAAMIGLDVATLLFALLVAVACAGLIAVLPALHASSSRPNDALKSSGRGHARTPRGHAPLVVAQVALTLIVLAGAGLMLKNVWHLQSIGTGVTLDDLLAVRLQLPGATYMPEQAQTFFARVTERLRALPGVDSVGMANCAPASGGCGGTTITFGGPRMDANAIGDTPVATYFTSPEYFETLRIAVLGGRTFSAADRRGQPRVVVVNEAAARAFWPGRNPVGQIVALGTGDFRQGAEVIGVVRDVQYEAIETDVAPGVYIPVLQLPRSALHIFVRSPTDTAALVSAIRREVRALDPNLPLADVRTMADRLGDATWRPRVSTWLLATFAALALLLTAVGVFGVMAEIVTQRTREFAVRVALGAQAQHVLVPLLERAAVLTAIGLVLGTAGGLGLTRFLTSLLYDVRASDPATFASAAGLLGVVALIASYIPARRAMRVDAMATLKGE
jgi:putative ABC transport system permease protein